MRVLEQETTAEMLRENKLKQCVDIKERKDLERVFGVERAKASERIIGTSERHDDLIKQEMLSLGLAE